MQCINPQYDDFTTVSMPIEHPSFPLAFLSSLTPSVLLPICSAGVYIKWKQTSEDSDSYSFGHYQKQYGEVSHNSEELALQGDHIDKRMHLSVRHAMMATLADDKDGTFRKVM